MNPRQPFEGPEKKLEIRVSPSAPSLRELGLEWWSEVADAAGARVLSSISNEECDAFLLSESSMFVHDRRALVITCGQTRLVDALPKILERVDEQSISLLIYKRKNENFPSLQPSTFQEDAGSLREMLPGREYRFGERDEHHVHLFHLDRPHQPEPDETVLEILMHGLSARALDVFSHGSGHSLELIRREALDRMLPGFAVDEHVFEPQGYSLNAISGAEYYTIHVTPQQVGSYVSFETNHRFDGDTESLVDRVVSVFEPASFDVVLSESPARNTRIVCSHPLRRSEAEELSSGYRVKFCHYYGRHGGADLNREARTISRPSLDSF